tara:strand:+ start:2039 stop:2941 length:903 start_codon:yes stop_codon:yes gene_type:complete
MKIIELILDEAQHMMGIDAISIVENPAMEENFLALKSDEVKLAEVNKEKKILMGALLIPNRPIFRTNGKEEYYIYFSKETVLKASQLYLKNGNQNNSTLEHSHELSGLTLVESWIVEDDVHDKSRKYGLNVPVGTWMGTLKVNNDEVWNDYVKTGKVKGFSIEGYFADKMQKPKVDMSEQKADLILSQIKDIVKGEKVELEKVELALVDDINNELKSLVSEYKSLSKLHQEYIEKLRKAEILGQKRDKGEKQILNKAKGFEKKVDKLKKAGKELGVDVNANYYEKQIASLKSAIKGKMYA